jgi:hypothetical protein
MSEPAGATTSAQETSAASGGCTTPHPSANFLARLQQQYEQGKLYDVIVRCVVLPETDQQEPEHEEEEEQSSSSNSSSSIKTRKRAAMTAEAPPRARRRTTNSQ